VKAYGNPGVGYDLTPRGVVQALVVGESERHPVTCRCRGRGWICEDHPDNAFAMGEPDVTCHCEAPGKPCPGPRVICPCGLPVSDDYVKRTGQLHHNPCSWRLS
jgi:hypothetical protein